MKKPKILALAVLILLLGFGSLWTFRHSPLIKRAPEKAWGSYAWVLGKEYRYTIDWQQNGLFQLSSLTPQGSQQGDKTQLPFHSGIKGILSLAPYKTLNGETRIFLWFEPSELGFIFGKQQVAVEKQLKEMLREPQGVILNADGQIKGYLFSEQSIPISRNIVRQLASELFPRLQDGAIVEDTMNGRVHAQLSHDCTNDVCAVNRDLERFEPRIKSSDAKLVGQFTYHLAANAVVLHAAKGSRELTLLRDGQPVNTDKLQLSLNLLNIRDVSQEQLAAWSKTLPIHVASVNGNEEYAAAELEQMRRLVKDTTFEAEIARFRALPATIDITSMLDLYKTLSAFLKLYPERVGEFAELLREFPNKDRRFDIVGVVLARNGEVPAQKEMLQAIDELWSEPEAVRLLSMSIALMDHPDDTTVASLIEKYDSAEPDESRGILLGNLAGAGFHSQNVELKGKILDRLVTAISKADSSSEKSDAFLALGNLGHDDSVDYVQKYVRSPQAQDRIWAAQGVRRVAGDRGGEATQILIELSEKDSDIQVRRVASSVMRGREFNPDQLEILATQLYKERDITVVMNILDSLADRSLNRERVHAILVAYFKECGTPTICKKVENMLLSK